MRPYEPLPTLLAAALTVTAAAAAPQAPAGGAVAGPFAERSSPAPPGSAQPNLAVAPDGSVWLSWLETRESGGHRLRLSRLHDDQWSEPVTVAEGDAFFANWADFPAVFVTSDGMLAVHWLERSAAGRYAYGVRLRTSTDGGRTWTAPVTPHSDTSPTEHGFVAFFEEPVGGLGLVWLDGREMTGGHGSGGSGSMTLRSASIRDGRPVDEQLIDARVCECCQTAAALSSAGPIVAYRDRSDDEIRDISVARRIEGRWSAPVTVHEDGWQLNACPVNGPAITARGESVAVAWFTGAGRTNRTKVAFSRDAGATFGPPVELSAGATLGRLGMVMPAADRVLVSSVERRDEEAHLVVRDVRAEGRVSDPTIVASVTPARASGFARMTVSGDRLFVAWTDVTTDAPPQVRVAQTRLR